jgi:hypothetical protein
MLYVIVYVTILVPFCLMDATFLTAMGSLLYKPALGDILLPMVKIGPAIVFYATYPIGLVIFAALPALKGGSVTTAIIYMPRCLALSLTPPTISPISRRCAIGRWKSLSSISAGAPSRQPQLRPLATT